MGLRAASDFLDIPPAILSIMSLKTPGAARLSRPMPFITASGGASLGAKAPYTYVLMRAICIVMGKPARSKLGRAPSKKACTKEKVNGGVGELGGNRSQVNLASRGSFQTTGKSGGVGMGWP